MLILVVSYFDVIRLFMVIGYWVCVFFFVVFVKDLVICVRVVEG